VNYAFFRDTGALTDQLLSALEPWCPALRALPRTFAAGIPPDATFESVLGPGLRVTCRDTVTRVHFLAEFTPADAARDFGVLRLDRQGMHFALERADPRVRALIGEGFLVHARYDVAAACFRAAAGASPDRELSYPLAVSLAAARRASEAETLWSRASRAGRMLDAGTMAVRLLGVGPAAAGRETTLVRVRSLAASVLRTPWDAGAQHELGRVLLEAGRARDAAFALSVAAGITGKAVDIAWLGRAYDAMGAEDEAYAAYTTALSAGLPKDIYSIVRDRFMAIGRARMAAEAGNEPAPGGAERR
jgi:tetratricopeptide (TPR) repeat protein